VLVLINTHILLFVGINFARSWSIFESIIQVQVRLGYVIVRLLVQN